MDASKINLPAPGQFGDVEPIESLREEAVRPDPVEETLQRAGIDFGGSEAFFTQEPPPFDWVVEGMLAAGSLGERAFKGDLVAGSKGRKSFWAMQLGLSVAAGLDFCGFRVPRPRRVAYFNLELARRGCWERLQAMCKALDLDPNVIWRNFTPLTIPFPGDLRRDDVLAALIRRLQEGEYGLAIIDPQYKLYDVGEDESTGVGLSGVLRFRDRIITESHAAVLTVMHDAKGGNTGDKKIADRGAGSGFAGRDYDSRWVLTPHCDGDDRHVVLSSSSRYRASKPDRTLVFDCEHLVFRCEEGICPLPQTSSTASENLTKQIRAKKSAEEAAQATAVIGRLASELKDGYEDLDAFTSKFIEETGWGLNRARSAIMACASIGVEIASTKEKRVKPDGTLGPILHARTLIGRPETISNYLASVKSGKEDENENGKIL